ncbi:MAG: ABC transporter permease [Limnochordia bacterium]|jgi:glycine betaine/proline transport system permease protein
MFPSHWQFHIAEPVNELVNRLLTTFAPFFDGLSAIILSLLLNIHHGLLAIPWWVIIALIGLSAWLTTHRWSLVMVLTTLPMLIGFFGLWALAMETLAIIITAVVIAVSVGIPLGIFMAEVRYIDLVCRPLLDAMQTMPSFVYLIPAMMFFGLGRVPAVLATVIYALPPVTRLTNLGLKQVSPAVEEAALAYGATRWQLLTEVRIPLAMPSILAGVNQTTMMALAMVVIASMIGARGLGYEVLIAINRIDVGRGLEAGLSVVILAIVIDRLTQGFAERWKPQNKRAV